MTTSTSKKPGHNAVKGKRGFQETSRSQSEVRLDAMSADLGTDRADAVSADLYASRAYDLRYRAQRALREAFEHPDSRHERAQVMRVVANAQVFVLLKDDTIDPAEAWGNGGVDAARDGTVGGATAAQERWPHPVMAERRDAIGEHMLNKAMESYEAFGDTNGQVDMYDGKDADRDAYIEAACLAMDDDGRADWVASEIKSIVDAEVQDGRDPRDLDVKELFIQARTTVAEKSGAARCSTCGASTVFDVDFGYSHCPNCG